MISLLCHPSAALGETSAAAKEEYPSASGRVFARDGDIVRVSGGTAEGFRTGGTCLFVLYSTRNFGQKDWEGFGRIVEQSLAGDDQSRALSRIEIISDYESADAYIEAVPDSTLGVQLGAGGGIVPLRHGPTYLAVGEVAEKQASAPGLMVNLRLRIPYLPLTELYLTGSFSWLRSPSPLEALFLEPGVEKGWLWGRVSPLMGVRYSVALLGMPVSTIFGPATANAKAHGVEGYTGIKIFVTPRTLIHLAVGYRHHSRIRQFETDERVYYFRNTQGGIWSVKLSGLTGRVVFTYEI